jgi:hypothetical protein
MFLYRHSLRFALILLATFCLASAAEAQIKKALKYLKKNQFESAQSAFEVDLDKPAEQACAEFYLAQLFANPKYEEGYDLTQAFNYVEKAIATAKKADAKARQKIDARHFGMLTMQKFRDDIINTALDRAEKKNSSAAYTQFLADFPNLNVAQIERATVARNRLAFDEATAINTGDAWENFWKKYRASCSTYSPPLYAQAERELFGGYMRQHSWRAYANFAYKYQDNIFVLDSVAAIKMQVTVQKNTIPAYKAMIEAHPQSPFVAIAVDSILSHTLRSSDVVDYDYFAHIYPNHPKIAFFWKQYFPLFCQTQGGCPDSFYQKYPTATKGLK